MKLVSNRSVRRQVDSQQRTLGQLGEALDSQAAAISGLANNQRILHDGFLAFYTRGFWKRVTWLIVGK